LEANVPEEPDLVSKSKSYDVPFSSNLIKDAQGLFLSYLDEKQKSAATFIRGVTTADGEHIDVTTDEDFYFRHDAVNTGSSHLRIGIGLAGILLEVIEVMDPGAHTNVRVSLPSRNHVDNVLELFAREESRLHASLRSEKRAEGDVPTRARPEPPEPTVLIGPGAKQDYQLDPRVIAASGKLFADGHYKAAAREAFVALIAAVRQKAGYTGGQDKDAMVQAFRENNGLLHATDDPNVQQGYQFLFAGAVSAIRNPLSHTPGDAIDEHEAMECLAFASLLFRYLDRSR
jgi:uncharacterized protein (TIGR02391 family)